MRLKFVFAMVATAGGLLTADPGFAQVWTLTSAPQDAWASLASSADGAKLVAVSYDQSPSYPFIQGAIYTSTNSGATWVLRRFGDEGWSSVASSADGTKLVAASVKWDGTVYNNTMYASTDSGNTWMPTIAPNPPVSIQFSVASSTDGTKLVAVEYGDSWIYTSTNAGATWQSNALPANGWTSLASSADGTKLVTAGGGSPGPIYASTNSGATWTQTSAPSERWSCVASSSDGSKVVAGYVGFKSQGGAIFVSKDSGATWAQTSAPIVRWTSIASSADGIRLAAVSDFQAGSIYTSSDSGTTWTANPPNVYAVWRYVALSADGNKLVAASPGGGIYTLQTTPTPILSLTPFGTNAVIFWTIPSMDFTLQQNSDLTTTNWTDVTTPPVLNLTNLQNQVIVSPTNGNTFFRLKH
jgi:hypothetical protein